jgi:hypothetical protein
MGDGGQRADRHRRDPITYRPPADTAGWLDDIAAREGRPVRRVVGDAVERARRIDEAGLAAFDREQDRRFMAWHTARAGGEDGAEELAALDAAIRAYHAAIREWQPPRRDSRADG